MARQSRDSMIEKALAFEELARSRRRLTAALIAPQLGISEQQARRWLRVWMERRRLRVAA